MASYYAVSPHKIVFWPKLYKNIFSQPHDLRKFSKLPECCRKLRAIYPSFLRTAKRLIPMFATFSKHFERHTVFLILSIKRIASASLSHYLVYSRPGMSPNDIGGKFLPGIFQWDKHCYTPLSHPHTGLNSFLNMLCMVLLAGSVSNITKKS